MATPLAFAVAASPMRGDDQPWPLILSARSCRTPRSRLVGSHGAGGKRFVVRGVSMGGSGFGRERDRFFLQAQVFDDPIDAAHAAVEAGLRQFLRDDVGCSVGSE